MITTNKPDGYPADLEEVSTQYQQAKSMINADPATRDTPAGRVLASVLALIPPMRAEIIRLRRRLTRTLADLRNLVAAARAALSADADGEPDPLYYLRDELEAQGYRPPDDLDGPS